MRVALYLRRSREEHQVESLATQRVNALAFIASQGWTVVEEYMEGEDGKDSKRAEFVKRPKFLAMLAAAKEGKFDILVLRDETRLGGDQIRTGMVLQDLTDYRIQVWYYATKELVRFDNATNKLIAQIKNFASEFEKEKLSSRSHEALKTRFERQQVVGGRVYGYDNVRTGGPKGPVHHAINEEQAAIVKEIFERYAAGAGLKAIVKELNLRGVPSPRAGSRGTGSWAPSAVRSMLRNERYRGKITWNKESEGIYRGGTNVRELRPQEEWITLDKPELRIIPEKLWASVGKRFSAKKPWGGDPRGRLPKYLLTGFVRCAECGGPLRATNGKRGKDIIKVYSCSYQRDRGDTVCSVKTRRPVEELDEVVLAELERSLLREEVIVEALQEVRRRLKERTSKPSELPALEDRAKELTRETKTLAEALLTTSSPLKSVTALLAEKEGQLEEITARIQLLKAAPDVLSLEAKRMELEARKRLADLKGMIGRSTDAGRKLLEQVLTGPLVATAVSTAEGARFQISGEATLGVQLVASPTGFVQSDAFRVRLETRAA